MIEPSEQIKARIDAEWLDEGRAIVAREREMELARDGLAWEMGDWIVGRETAYGDMGRLAAELDVPLGTLKNRASVARRIEPPRRRDDLSWSHHAEVAGLEPDEGDAVLAEASLYNWSVERLRGEMKERSARRRAEREVERLKAELAARDAEMNADENAKRIIASVRSEIAEGAAMIEEGYRRILMAAQREDLKIAAAALHGNAQRKLVPSFEAVVNRAVDRTEPVIRLIDSALQALPGAHANRHDAGTIETPDMAGNDAPDVTPGVVSGDTS